MDHLPVYIHITLYTQDWGMRWLCCKVALISLMDPAMHVGGNIKIDRLFPNHVSTPWNGPPACPHTCHQSTYMYTGVFIRRNGTVEWNDGMEWWNGTVDKWNETVVRECACADHVIQPRACYSYIASWPSLVPRLPNLFQPMREKRGSLVREVTCTT